jgi:hypothetical protein
MPHATLARYRSIGRPRSIGLLIALLLVACAPPATAPAPSATSSPSASPPAPTQTTAPSPTPTPLPLAAPLQYRDLPFFSAANAAELDDLANIQTTGEVAGIAFVPQEFGYSLWAAIWDEADAPSRLEHWTLYSSELAETITPAEFLAPKSLSAGSDGALLATTDECCLRLWDPAAGQIPFEFELSPKLEEALIAPGDGGLLAVGYDSPDGTVVLVDIPSSETLAVFRHGEYVNDIDFSSDGRYLASGAFNGTVKVIDVEELGETFPYDAGGEVSAVALEGSPPGSGAAGHLLATAVDGQITLWDGAVGEVLRTLASHDAPIDALDFSPNGEILASGDREGAVTLWDTVTGDMITGAHIVGGPSRLPSPITQILFSPNGTLLAVATSDGQLIVFAIFE